VPLTLASSSPIRHAMLASAGVAHETVPSIVNENVTKSQLVDPADISVTLAEAKALDVSSSRPGDWVIGSDSMLSVGDRLFDKPIDREQAADHLRFFSGKPLKLTSAVALARDGRADWRHVEYATLYVRTLSDAFIDSYLDLEWPDVAYCVGVFRMEGRGVQLFERISGDYFVILGMPLIPLLGALRDRGLMSA
jgi:septum formation protein